MSDSDSEEDSGAVDDLLDTSSEEEDSDDEDASDGDKDSDDDSDDDGSERGDDDDDDDDSDDEEFVEVVRPSKPATATAATTESAETTAPPVKKQPPKKHAPKKHLPKAAEPLTPPGPDDDPEVIARWEQLQSEFLTFSNYRLLPNGNVKKEEVVTSFRQRKLFSAFLPMKKLCFVCFPAISGICSHTFRQIFPSMIRMMPLQQQKLSSFCRIGIIEKFGSR
jgi:hypothetical protein